MSAAVAVMFMFAYKDSGESISRAAIGEESEPLGPGFFCAKLSVPDGLHRFDVGRRYAVGDWIA
jgi:hypothetical protein